MHNISPPPNKHRNTGLDIVRSIACITVIASHFFLHTDFKTAPFEGVSMYFQGMLSSIAVGSDLYMILTGFLCCNKEFGKKFYLSGIKVIASYIFFSLATIAVNVYLFHTGMTWKSGLMGILSFSTIPYAWYIEMWIGLFLMAPFLNIWYRALPNARMKRILIILLFSLSAFPDFFNRYGLTIMPEFWVSIYPLAFYFAGCYLREYRPGKSRLLLLLLVVIIAAISPTVTMLSGHPTFLHFIGGRSGFFMAAIALSIFLMFYECKLNSLLVRDIFKWISLRSLDIFLCSAIMDFYLYPLFKAYFFINQSQYGIMFFVIVPTIFIICYVIASVKRLIFAAIDILLVKYKVGFTIQNKG